MGRIAPGKDKKIVYVDENLSIDVAVVDERGNQVTTGNLAKMAVKLVVLSSQKFGHDSDGYWERQKFMDAVQEHLATTNASFLLKEGQFLCKNFTIKNSSKRHRFQLGVMITDQTISETYGRILEGVSNHFYVEVKRGGTLFLKMVHSNAVVVHLILARVPVLIIYFCYFKTFQASLSLWTSVVKRLLKIRSYQSHQVLAEMSCASFKFIVVSSYN